MKRGTDIRKKRLMKALTKVAVILFLVSLFCSSSVNTVFAADDEEEKYVVVYYIDDSKNVIVYHQRYLKDSSKNTLDLTNLVLHPECIDDSLTYSFSFNTDASMSNDVRCSLLYKGFASIIDTSIALPEEIEAEKHAKDKALGIWGIKPLPLEINPSDETHPVDESTPTSDTQPNAENSDGPSFLEKAFFFIKEKVFDNPIVRWVGGSVLSFSAIYAFAQYLIKNKRVLLFFGGEKGAGKTTLRKAIMEPDTPEEELKGTVPTRADSSVRYIRDDVERKIILVSKLVDVPGDDKHHVINYLTSKKHKAFRKSFLIIVVAPTMENERCSVTYDQEYIDQQLSVIKSLWIAVIKAKATRVNEVILFINKSDLCRSTSELEDFFSPHATLLRKACNESGARFTCVVGSSVKRIGVKRVLSRAMDRKKVFN